MATVYSMGNCRRFFALGCTQISQGLNDSPIEPGSGMVQEQQSGRDTIPFGGEGNRRSFLAGLGTGFVKIGYVGVNNDGGEQPEALARGGFFCRHEKAFVNK